MASMSIGRITQSITMTIPTRFRLLFGPYHAPRFRYGRRVVCERAGLVELCGLSAGPIPWPLGKRPGSKARGLVLYADLVRAVRQESASARGVLARNSRGGCLTRKGWCGLVRELNQSARVAETEPLGI